MENPDLYRKLSDYLCNNTYPLEDAFGIFFITELKRFIEFDKNDDKKLDRDAIFSYGKSLIAVGSDVLAKPVMQSFVRTFYAGIMLTLVRLIDNEIEFKYDQ